MPVARRCLVIVPAVAFVATLLTAAPAAAAPPGNDHPDGATVITTLPSSEVANLEEATRDDVGCGFDRSVWYRYTPEVDVTLEAALFSRLEFEAVGVFAGEPSTET